MKIDDDGNYVFQASSQWAVPPVIVLTDLVKRVEALERALYGDGAPGPLTAHGVTEAEEA